MVDFLTDNLIALLGVLWLVVVIGMLVAAGLAAWRLWRVMRSARARVQPALDDLAAAADEARRGADALRARQGELTVASDALRRRADAAVVAGGHAGNIVSALRYPVRFLSGL